MRDALGRILRVGDVVCYPVMNRGDLGLQFSVIVELRDKSIATKLWSAQDSGFKKSSIRRTDRIVKVPTDQVYMAAMGQGDDEQTNEMLNLYRLSTSLEP